MVLANTYLRANLCYTLYHIILQDLSRNPLLQRNIPNIRIQGTCPRPYSSELGRPGICAGIPVELRTCMIFTPGDEESQTLNIRVPELGMAAHGMIFPLVGVSFFICWFTQQEFLKLLLYFCTCHCPWNTHTETDGDLGSVFSCLWNITGHSMSFPIKEKARV